MLCCTKLYSREHHHIHSGSFKKLSFTLNRGGGSKCSTSIQRWKIQVLSIGWLSLGMSDHGLKGQRCNAASMEMHPITHYLDGEIKSWSQWLMPITKSRGFKLHAPPL